MKLKILELVLCFSFIMTSCQKNREEVLDNNPNSIKVIAQTAVDESFSTTSQDMSGNFLKTAYANPTVNWIINDKIGVYSDKATVVATAGIAKNVSFNCDLGGNRSASFTSSLPITYATGTNLFYAYYPFTGTTGTVPTGMTGYNVPITLPSESQTQIGTGVGHIGGANDFMVAAITSGQTSGTVGFTFNHVFAILRFALKTTTSNAFNLTQIDLAANGNICAKAGDNVGSLDITQNVAPTSPYSIGNLGNPPTYKTAINLVLSPNLPLNTTYVAYAYIMIIPGTYTTLDITYSKGPGTPNQYSIPQKTGTFNFERGKMYTTTLTIPGW